jgi:hypothetical protein
MVRIKDADLVRPVNNSGMLDAISAEIQSRLAQYEYKFEYSYKAYQDTDPGFSYNTCLFIRDIVRYKKSLVDNDDGEYDEIENKIKEWLETKEIKSYIAEEMKSIVLIYLLSIIHHIFSRYQHLLLIGNDCLHDVRYWNS